MKEEIKPMDTTTIKSILIPLQEAQRRLREHDPNDYSSMKALMDAESEIIMKYGSNDNQ